MKSGKGHFIIYFCYVIVIFVSCHARSYDNLIYQIVDFSQWHPLTNIFHHLYSNDKIEIVQHHIWFLTYQKWVGQCIKNAQRTPYVTKNITLITEKFIYSNFNYLLQCQSFRSQSCMIQELASIMTHQDWRSTIDLLRSTGNYKRVNPVATIGESSSRWRECIIG